MEPKFRTGRNVEPEKKCRTGRNKSRNKRTVEKNIKKTKSIRRIQDTKNSRKGVCNDFEFHELKYG